MFYIKRCSINLEKIVIYVADDKKLLINNNMAL